MTWKEILGPERIAKGLFWTKAWSLVSGCTPVSPGCAHCWLRDMAHRFPKGYPEGICTPEGQWTGEVVVHPERLDLPLKTKKPQVWAIWSDLGHEDVPLKFFQDAWVVMMESGRLNLGHIFLLITKRPEALSKIMRPKHPPENIYLVVTAENQEQADKRLSVALQIPAAKRIVLIEPCLSSVDLCNINGPGEIQPAWSISGDALKFDALSDNEDHLFQAVNHLDGVIAGGETGPYARPAHPDWFLQVRDDSVSSGVPFFFKGWGEWKHGSEHGKKILVVYNDGRTCEFTKEVILAEEKRSGIDHQRANPTLMSRVGKKAAGRLLDGRTWEELPE